MESIFPVNLYLILTGSQTIPEAMPVRSPMVRAMLTVKNSSIDWEQLNRSRTSSSGTRAREEWQEVSVSFTPLTVHTVH